MTYISTRTGPAARPLARPAETPRPGARRGAAPRARYSSWLVRSMTSFWMDSGRRVKYAL